MKGKGDGELRAGSGKGLKYYEGTGTQPSCALLKGACITAIDYLNIKIEEIEIFKHRVRPPLAGMLFAPSVPPIANTAPRARNAHLAGHCALGRGPASQRRNRAA